MPWQTIADEELDRLEAASAAVCERHRNVDAAGRETAAMSDPSTILGQSLALRRGAPLRNRFVKSAMSETLGKADGGPSAGLATLYRTWAEGGVGLMITGNVMVDGSAIGEPGNVVVEDDRHMDALRAWAAAGHLGGAQTWMQINHPGKQAPKLVCAEPVAPSAVPLDARLASYFHAPRALSEDEIESIIGRFAATARLAKEAGFSGVQIHGAHGYLVSQFLSPHHNRREDRWGGTPENRMRFVLEVYRAIRAAVGDGFSVGLKQNSADFQRGGFSEEESMDVVAAVSAAGVDLIEVSGGSYEAPAMTGAKVRDSTQKREAYFLDYAQKVRDLVDVPLLVTGGFRTATGMADALAGGAVDLVGLARPLCIEPDLPARILGGEDFHSKVRPIRTGIKALDRLAFGEVTWYAWQLGRMAAGKPPKPNRNALVAALVSLVTSGWRGMARRRA